MLHVPNFGYSLLSVSKMAQNGLKVSFENKACEIKHDSKTIATAKLVDKLYVLDIAHNKESAMVHLCRHGMSVLHMCTHKVLHLWYEITW